MKLILQLKPLKRNLNLIPTQNNYTILTNFEYEYYNLKKANRI